MNIKKAVSALILVALIAFAFFPTGQQLRVVKADVSGDWPMFGHDPAHTGTAHGTGPTKTPVVLWTFQAKGVGIIGSSAIVDGRIYFTDITGVLYCLDASTGTQSWIASGQESPAVSDGAVFVGSNLITEYNASTGAKIWSDQPPYGTGGNSPVIANGVVYTSLRGVGYYAYNASTGAKIWNNTTNDTISSPALSNDIVYFGGYTAFAVNASSGNQIWRFAPKINTAQTYRGGSPTVSGGYLYEGLSDSFYCLDALTGDKVWNFSAGAFGTSPAVSNGIVFFGSQDHNVYALNASTGAKIWDFTTGYFVDSAPAVADGAVYVGSGDGNLYALNASTGVKLWNFTLQPQLDQIGSRRYLFASPAIVNGVIYMGSSDGVVYALGTSHPSPPSTSAILFSLAIISAGIVITVAAIVCFRKRKNQKLRKQSFS
jgi:outer membrane protein assembly factor BamB